MGKHVSFVERKHPFSQLDNVIIVLRSSEALQRSNSLLHPVVNVNEKSNFLLDKLDALVPSDQLEFLHGSPPILDVHGGSAQEGERGLYSGPVPLSVAPHSLLHPLRLLCCPHLQEGHNRTLKV